MKHRQDNKPAPMPGALLLHQHQQQNVHIGPLPPPESLRVYESVLKGLAERIVVMAEAEQNGRFRMEDHRHEEAMQTTREAFAAERRGQVFALVSVVVLTGSAVACAVLGVVKIGVALAGATIVGVVAAFLHARKRP